MAGSEETCLGGGFGCLVGHGDQRGLGHGRAESQGEGKGKQPAQAALAGEGAGHGLAEGEEAHLQALHEHGEAEHDRRQVPQRREYHTAE